MTVIMVLLTFAIFLLIDYVRGQKQLAKQPVLQTANGESAAPVVPAVVAGFQVPENLGYHAGHTWALSETHELVQVGIDDFASELVEAWTTSRCRNVDAGFARRKRFGPFSATASR